jgi:hypothetical protein
MTEVRQGIQVLTGLKVHATAIAAIAAIRAAELDVFFTPKAHGSVATVSGFNLDACFIYKFHGIILAFLKVP